MCVYVRVRADVWPEDRVVALSQRSSVQRVVSIGTVSDPHKVHPLDAEALTHLCRIKAHTAA